MFEAFKNLLTSTKTKIVDEILRVEKEHIGEPGSEKRKIAVQAIAGLYDIPAVPNFIENPIKIAVIGYFIDIVVEKLNWLAGWQPWEDADDTLDSTGRMKIASIADAPIDTKFVEICKENNSIDARLDALYEQYGIKKTITPPPTMPEPKPVEPAPTAKENLIAENPEPGAVWARCLQLVKVAEGGRNFSMINGAVVLNPRAIADKGGPTAYGITKSVAEAHGYLIQDVTPAIAEAIYKADYFDRYGLGELKYFEPAYCLFDTCVNHGPGGMARLAQKTFNALWSPKIAVDGKWGPKTHDGTFKIANSMPLEYVRRFLEFRKTYYDDIIKATPSQEAFRKGWYNRIRLIASVTNVESPV